MFSLRTIATRRAPKALLLCTRCLTLSSRPLSARAPSNPKSLNTSRPQLPLLSKPSLARTYADRTTADETIDTLTEQFATARDEFEMATEETERNSVYAAGDREAARMELDKLLGMYEEELKGEDGEEIKSRIGHRIRELDHAVKALEEKAMEH